MITVLQAVSSGVIDNISGNSNIGSQNPINNTTTTIQPNIDIASLIIGLVLGLGIAIIAFGIYYFIKSFTKEIKEDVIEQVTEKLKKESENKNNDEEQ
ncbi:MAG: hypothetical protein J6Q68_04670 [Clostridia bacterium]|nr:hypothetical protein [Clostridia bacterium]